jgi:hypothetical protein
MTGDLTDNRWSAFGTGGTPYGSLLFERYLLSLPLQAPLHGSREH